MFLHHSCQSAARATEPHPRSTSLACLRRRLLCYRKRVSGTTEITDQQEEQQVKFDLDEEQSDIRALARRFTEEQLTPNAGEWDERNYFPREAYTRMAELGLMGMTTPESDGGSALSRLSGALVYEELARGDMATAVGLSVHNMVTGSIARFGGEEQRHRWVQRLAAGELLGA